MPRTELAPGEGRKMFLTSPYIDQAIALIAPMSDMGMLPTAIVRIIITLACAESFP